MLLGMLNTPEVIVILVLALILFGSKKLPELARGLGQGIKEFKKATRDVQDELTNAMNAEPPYSPPPASPPPPSPPASAAPTTTTAATDAPPAAPADTAPPQTVTASEPPKAA